MDERHSLTPDQVTVPRHFLSPGEEGYRTPTIEDFEQNDGNEKRASSALALDGAHGAPPLPTDIHQELYRVATSREPVRRLEKHKPKPNTTHGLNWRYRVKHFTWAYFALSMATGGLCNVLWTGESTVLPTPRLTD